MKYFLSTLFFIYQSVYFTQIDSVGNNDHYIEKKLKIKSEVRNTYFFLDGNYVGTKNIKIKTTSKAPNYLYVTYPDGSSYSQTLSLSSTPEQISTTPTQKTPVNRQAPEFFDSIAVHLKFDISDDSLIGYNGERPLVWTTPSNSILLSHQTIFERSLATYFTLNGIPCQQGLIDTNRSKHLLELHITKLTVNVQPEFGYVDAHIKALVKNARNKIIYRQSTFGVHAEYTKKYSFYNGVDSTLIHGINQLINNKNFIGSIKRATPRAHKEIEKIVVEKEKTEDKTKVNIPKALTKFDRTYLDGTARIKTTKGLSVGVVIAESGYVLTNTNNLTDDNNVYVKVHGQKTMRGKVLRRGTKTGVALIQVISKQEFKALTIAKSIPTKEDTVATVMPSKTWTFKKGTYQNEIAVFGQYLYTVKIETGKNTDGTPLLSENGEILAIYNEKVAANKAQRMGYFTPIQDAMRDLNLKLE